MASLQYNFIVNWLRNSSVDFFFARFKIKPCPIIKTLIGFYFKIYTTLYIRI